MILRMFLYQYIILLTKEINANTVQSFLLLFTQIILISLIRYSLFHFYLWFWCLLFPSSLSSPSSPIFSPLTSDSWSHSTSYTTTHASSHGHASLIAARVCLWGFFDLFSSEASFLCFLLGSFLRLHFVFWIIFLIFVFKNNLNFKFNKIL